MERAQQTDITAETSAWDRAKQIERLTVAEQTPDDPETTREWDDGKQEEGVGEDDHGDPDPEVLPLPDE